jgi:hypothetical protein
LREIETVNSKSAKDLETEYATHEKLFQKPTEEELVEEVKKSYCFISEVKGRYGVEIDKKVEALEGILEPEKGKEKVASFVDFDARHGKKSEKRMFTGYKAHIAEDEIVRVVHGSKNVCDRIRLE